MRMASLAIQLTLLYALNGDFIIIGHVHRQALVLIIHLSVNFLGGHNLAGQIRFAINKGLVE